MNLITFFYLFQEAQQSWYKGKLIILFYITLLLVFPIAASANTVSSHAQNQTSPVSNHKPEFKNHGIGPDTYNTLSQVAGTWDPAEVAAVNFTLKTTSAIRFLCRISS